ncbi:unnamed protein product [Spodoptera exigua]|nr:unnamed protein product [Spodoptera exigua]
MCSSGRNQADKDVEFCVGKHASGGSKTTVFFLQRRRGRGGRRRGRQRVTTNPPDDDSKNGSSTEVPIARAADIDRKGPVNRSPHFDMYEPPGKEWESGYVEMPKDLYQAHLRPGVIFRIHMSEAILKMQYRNYGEDKDESVIEADVEYLRLTRKVINDEITKFEDLQWLIGWFHNRSELIKEHLCNTRYYTVGTPPTMFTHSEEYMKRLCLFDSVYIDHIPYVIGEDSSIMAAVAPPVLHCDAASCTSVPFIDRVGREGVSDRLLLAKNPPFFYCSGSRSWCLIALTPQPRLNISPNRAPSIVV